MLLCLLQNFSILTFLKEFIQEQNLRSNGLDLSQDRHFVGPDLGPNCSQKLY